MANETTTATDEANEQAMTLRMRIATLREMADAAFAASTAAMVAFKALPSFASDDDYEAHFTAMDRAIAHHQSLRGIIRSEVALYNTVLEAC